MLNCMANAFNHPHLYRGGLTPQLLISSYLAEDKEYASGIAPIREGLVAVNGWLTRKTA